MFILFAWYNCPGHWSEPYQTSGCSLSDDEEVGQEHPYPLIIPQTKRLPSLCIKRPERAPFKSIQIYLESESNFIQFIAFVCFRKYYGESMMFRKKSFKTLCFMQEEERGLTMKGVASWLLDSGES